IAETVAQMSADGVTRAAAICLAPQNSRTSVGLYRRAVLAEAGTKIKIVFVDSWHDHPLLIQAFAEKLYSPWRSACSDCGTEVPVLFTAHSVPERTIQEGDPYDVQCRQTAELVAAKIPGLKPEDWRFAFQSQGMSGGAWIGPTVEETIVQLQAGGAKAVILQPIGFVCDHVEILYDIDIGFKQFAGTRGMMLTRARSLNDSPAFIAALADLAASTLGIALPQKVPS
ncbi:MAG: ferrochelatase, partial [Candidatus Acidiferrum sp.]